MGRPPCAMQTLEKRFWKNVRKTKKCWVWTGSKRTNGYGTIYTGNYRNDAAHRVSWLLKHGAMPKFTGSADDVLVLHRCDTPLCVRPSHLFLGTQKDNVADMIAKGRRKKTTAKGEQVGTSKLTKRDVMEIRKRYTPRVVTRPFLAREYGVSVAAIKAVLARRNWAWV